jgi:hypothetical protein
MSAMVATASFAERTMGTSNVDELPASSTEKVGLVLSSALPRN